METIINVYRDNYFLIAYHVLLLGVILWAVVRVHRHPGPSACVVVAVLWDFVAFFSSLLLGRDGRLYAVLDHVRRGGYLVGFVLLYLAVFGWRSRDRQPCGQDMGVRPDGLPATIVPVRIPVAWIATLTVVYVLALPIGYGMGHIFEDAQGDPPDMLMVLGVLAFSILLLVDVILTLEILHRAWRAIQDDYVRTTPNKAVSYLCIPIYNLYWMFVAFAGLARDFNAFTARYGLRVRRLSEGLLTLQCVLTLVGLVVMRIPVTGIISGVISIAYPFVVATLGLALLWSITGAVNDLYASVIAARTAPSETGRIEPAPPPPEIPDRACAPPGYFD